MTNSASKQAIFTIQGNYFPIHNAAANTASDGSGTLPTLVTAAADGTRIDGVKIMNAQATAAASSAMVCRVFITDNAGANPRLVGEVALSAATRSTSAIGATSTITFSPALILRTGQLLKICQSVYAGAQDQTSWLAYAGDY